MSEKKDYCIGLDIGTNSTGYAMTDLEGYLLKHKKRSTFGAVLFEDAQTAADRRMHRSARRRLDRREQRINLLQELMEPCVLPVDPSFFLRMNETFLQEEDRELELLSETLPESVWTDGSESNVPTIYHLRQMLIEADKQADIRYVYLALHHIIKYRGNFLMEGETLDEETRSITERIMDILNQFVSEPYNWVFCTDEEVVVRIRDILQTKGMTNTARMEAIVNCLNPDKASQKAAKALAGLLVGMKSKLSPLFLCESDLAVQFSGEFENEDEVVSALGSAGELFDEIYSVFQWKQFANLRAEGETLSQTMIRKYEQHRVDLARLKDWVRTYAPDQYKKLFKVVDPKVDNYASYTRHFDKEDISGQAFKRVKQADFYNMVKKVLESNKSEAAAESAKPMLQAMQEDNGFLPLQRINFNGAIPYQLHAEELGKIIDNQGRFYPELLRNKDKIMSLCTFRLPYYVGPLNTSSPFQKWLVRDESVKIRPWNFFDVVDREKTADGFIANLTNKCTYLPGEDVLPLHSLLYEEYLLLDELNRVTVNGKLIPEDLKKRIIEELFKKRKNVTKKAFEEWLSVNVPTKNGYPISTDRYHGDNGFAASLRTYIDFTEKVGIPVNETTIPMIENLVRWSTIFEDRSILREKIQKAYPELTQKQVKYVCQRRYTGWGRLSKKLLDGIQGSEQAEGKTILDMMRETNNNFMKVINNKHYGFDRAIEANQPIAHEGKITLEEVQALQGSPALKRSVWQAVRIVEELIQVQGKQPTVIYIENTRGEDESQKGRRMPDRIKMLEDWYKGSKVQVPKECTDLLSQCKTDKVRLNDRQYLYFLQLGKCLYSGKQLDFEHLEQYQVDHILPQSYIKDDSIDNRALVYQSENQRKKDSLLLDEAIQRSRTGWWQYLKDLGLISEKKYKNLTRKVVSEEEVVRFITRQLTETSQIIKHVTTLFKAHYPDVKVHAINANLSSSIRDSFKLYKIRDLNNTHHAYDAFLACTIGCFTDTYFSWIGDDSVAGSMAKARWDSSKTEEKGIILGQFVKDQVDKGTGEVLWDASEHIAYLKQVLNYKDHFIVNKPYEFSGGFFNETRYPAGSSAKVPFRKNLPIERYGGFDSVSPAYIAAISYQKGKKRVGTLVNVPAYLAKDIEKDPDVLVRYLSQEYKNVKIIKPKILLNQTVIYDGSELLLRSAREARNAKELYLPKDMQEMLDRMINRGETVPEEEIDKLNTLLIEKLEQYYPIYSGVAERIRSKWAILQKLTVKEKNDFARETIKVMQASGQFANYTSVIPKLGLSNNQGRITNKPFDLSKLKLINQSITGFMRSEEGPWNSEQL